MSITYGISVKAFDDPYIDAAEEGARALFTVAIPGTFLVDSLPWLRWVPEWMPGAGFKTKARQWKKTAEVMLNDPFDVTKSDMVHASRHSTAHIAHRFELRQTVMREILSSLKLFRKRRRKVEWMKRQSSVSRVQRQLFTLVSMTLFFPSLCSHSILVLAGSDTVSPFYVVTNFHHSAHKNARLSRL
jgi:hypothetical protein